MTPTDKSDQTVTRRGRSAKQTKRFQIDSKNHKMSYLIRCILGQVEKIQEEYEVIKEVALAQEYDS